jgi:hypothetical protein
MKVIFGLESAMGLGASPEFPFMELFSMLVG